MIDVEKLYTKPPKKDLRPQSNSTSLILLAGSWPPPRFPVLREVRKVNDGFLGLGGKVGVSGWDRWMKSMKHLGPGEGGRETMTV